MSSKDINPQKSLDAEFEALPENEKNKINTEFFEWYTTIIKLYHTYFEIEDTTIREFKTPEEVCHFFKESIMWWERKKPILSTKEKFTILDLFKTRQCLAEIKALFKKFDNTEIPREYLNIKFAKKIEPESAPEEDFSNVDDLE
jgi:hypothetical protein